MDKSEKYLLMCRKATEIQAKKSHGQQEFYRDFDNGRCWVPIWLPRQDQLQEMGFMNIGDTINIRVNRFYRFCLEFPYKTGYLATALFNTMEQLWLAFVMKEIYCKVWDDKGWIDG